MGISSWGGGIVLGLVAVLWLVYLVPSWHKRQEYLATERNAVRLQQTLRIMAATAELPGEVRVEANARSVADAQKILRSEETKREAIRRAQEAARQRSITRELAATAPVLRAAGSHPALAARRVRRTRLVATAVLMLSVVVAVFGFTHALTAWIFGVSALVAGAGSIAVLTQLAAVSKARARRSATGSAAAAPPIAQRFTDFAPDSALAEAATQVQDPGASVTEQASRSWSPVAMPRPLYLRRGSERVFARSSSAAGAPMTADDSEALRLAAQRSAEALRRAQQEAQAEALLELARAEAALDRRRSDAGAGMVAAATAGAAASDSAPEQQAKPTVSAPAPTGRFARMGYLDETATAELRLDEVLQRRRAV